MRAVPPHFIGLGEGLEVMPVAKVVGVVLVHVGQRYWIGT